LAAGGGRGLGFSPLPPPQAQSISDKPAQAMPSVMVRISDLYRTRPPVSESAAVSIWRQRRQFARTVRAFTRAPGKSSFLGDRGTRQDLGTKPGRPMKILIVCLGNICRSPTAEGVVRTLAAREFPQLDLEVDSAGTAAYHVGEPPDRRSIAAARRHGYEISHLRARQVTRADFDEFDYVLAMDGKNLAELERLRPADSRAALGTFLDHAATAGADDVPDPYHGGIEDFDRVVELSEIGARGWLRALARPK
jgi:protein-tyrosine phosphatase